MTTQLRIFVDCPFGGCEDGYCACLECDLDAIEICGELAPQDAALLAAIEAGAELITVRGRTRLVKNVPIPIDNYPPTAA